MTSVTNRFVPGTLFQLNPVSFCGSYESIEILPEQTGYVSNNFVKSLRGSLILIIAVTGVVNVLPKKDEQYEQKYICFVYSCKHNIMAWVALDINQIEKEI